MPPTADADTPVDEKIARLKGMVRRLLQDLRRREEEVHQLALRKDQLAAQVLDADRRLQEAGLGTVGAAPSHEDATKSDARSLRQRVKLLEDALAAAQGGEQCEQLAELRADNERVRRDREHLLHANAELELELANLRASTSLRDKLRRELERESSEPPSGG